MKTITYRGMQIMTNGIVFIVLTDTNEITFFSKNEAKAHIDSIRNNK
jgi:hypothetical protein